MNTKKFSDAISEVNDRYIDEAIHYKYKRRRQSRIKWGIMVACLCLAVISSVTLIDLNKPNQPIGEKPPVNQYGITQSSTTLAEKTDLYYSELIGKTDTANEDILSQFAENTADIAAFNESMIENCSAIIEGEVTDIHLKNYSFTTADDKFGEGGSLNYRVSSVVYEIKVAKVWYGEMKVGDTIIIEDELFFVDEILAIKMGHRYVIPVYEAGNEIWRFNAKYKELLSGDIQRDSIYSTIYPFHPQIEVVTEGYIVSEDWETLTSGEKSNIIMDVELGKNGSFYADKMRLIPTKTFLEQMNILIEKIVN